MVKQKVIEKADHAMEEKVTSALAAAAIRYYLVKFTVESQIVFDFDEALKTTGIQESILSMPMHAPQAS